MSALPAHAARVLGSRDEAVTVRDLVALGINRAEALASVRRSSARFLRLDAIEPALASAIAAAFVATGGEAHTGPSAYGDDVRPEVRDLVLLGTAGQLEALAARLGPTVAPESAPGSQVSDGRRAGTAGVPPAPPPWCRDDCRSTRMPDVGGGAVADAIRRALTAATWGAGTLHLGRFRLDLSRRVAVMGILNVTPDSFHDGGRYLDPGRAVERGLAMVEEGADVIDVGGDSASGDAAPIDADEEVRRVEPVIRALARQVDVPVAIDTHRARTAAAALDAGASLVNDITGLADPEMPATVARSECGVCVMHIKGVPKQFPPDWHYRNVMGDIVRFLEERTSLALDAGVAPERICVDPGLEFGKLVGQDLEILRRLDELHVLGYPILLAASRKTLVGNVLGGLPSSDRLEGTAAVNAFAIARGARIIRVHDVRAMARVARMTEALAGMSVDGTPMERCRADGVIVDPDDLTPLSRRSGGGVGGGGPHAAGKRTNLGS